jgi:hypothetical protein
MIVAKVKGLISARIGASTADFPHKGGVSFAEFVYSVPLTLASGSPTDQTVIVREQFGNPQPFDRGETVAGNVNMDTASGGIMGFPAL